jgi:hypothetical protein
MREKAMSLKAGLKTVCKILLALDNASGNLQDLGLTYPNVQYYHLTPTPTEPGKCHNI